MNLKLFTALFLMLSFCTAGLYAQKAPIKFGKVDREDLEMTDYENDPGAAAVVLCSYGYYDADSYTYFHNYRVKILKKEGYDLATRQFPTSMQSRVRGKTFNLVDGEIVAEKLTSESVFKERVVEDFYLVNVAMPNVKEGSVIDLEISYEGFPFNFYFQEEIPVVWSELRIEPIRYITYRKNFFGYETLVINDNDYGRWAAENMPAFKEEPFMDSRENYITKFEFDIITFGVPGYKFYDLATTWEEVSETLMESYLFGDLLGTGPAIKRKAKAIDEVYTSPDEKLKAAIAYVQEIEYNGLERCFASEESFNTIIDNKTGNSADINLMLVKLLREMNIKAYPVVLSTKDHGILSPVFPSLRKLNYVVVLVETSGKPLLIDATEKKLPPGMLPQRCLNWRGRLVDEVNTRWIELGPEKNNQKLAYYDLQLNEDNTLTGSLTYRRSDYAAYNFRKKYETFAGNESYLESFVDKHHGLTVTGADIQNLEDIREPVIDQYTVEIVDKIYAMDSTLYLQPALFEQMEENPFKISERKYPVDFSTPIDETGMIKFTLPNNYEVTELPRPVKIALPDDKASFTYSINQTGNTLLLNYKFKVNKTMFGLNEYENLKTFYNEVIKKQAEPVVIKINGHDS